MAALLLKLAITVVVILGVVFALGVPESVQAVKALAISGGAMVVFFVILAGPDRLLDAIGTFFDGIGDGIRGLFDGLGDVGGSGVGGPGGSGGSGGGGTGGGTSYTYGHTYTQVPNIAYHGTSAEAAYHILKTHMFKILNGTPAGLWVTTDFNTAQNYAQNTDGNNGLIVELQLSFSSYEMTESDMVTVNTGNPELLSKSLLAKGIKIVKLDDAVFCILGEYTDDDEYVEFPEVTPIRLLDQNGNQVA